MPSFNKVILMGNLTRDPELAWLGSGSAVCKMGLAVSEKYRSKDGGEKEYTTFVDIKAWGKQGEACDAYLAKGSPVMVEGRLVLEEWETKQGDKRSKLLVRADRVQFLGRPRGNQDDTSEREPSAPPSSPRYDDGDNLPF